ncbi:hypothetical protein F8568_036800 [Actinomadura sp. LD22]|uniref:Helix-turn-helix domain-containing protein n=1 Tax=Actinomadura physcomitrii TaxID=2650748 RepID=A0A6I4MJ41_9ACTN|nr:hypothetical protein [Actinomadura physcomitrii]MWA05822.1 hypothetical protein [Actinomadura physcomitrii]
MTVRWSREALEALGPVTDVPTTASVLQVSDWTVYEAIRRGEWTMTRVLRLGRMIKIPTNDLITLLYGAGPAAGPAADTVPEDATTHEPTPLRAV